LTGVYHLSRRQAVRLMDEMFGVQMSLGTVSRCEKDVAAALEPAVQEVLEHVLRARVKHTDGTSWLQRGVQIALWTIATAGATFFRVLEDNRSATLQTKLLTQTTGILVSDRATALKFWPMKRRQICWAHLVRKFVSFSGRDGPVGEIGGELLEYARLVFSYWRRYHVDEALSPARYRELMAPVRKNFEALLHRAVDADLPPLSGSCADLVDHCEALWTFVDTPGVQPTNNDAERELRAFVLWRKGSFGTQSDRGNIFAERIMTVVHTARKQGLGVLDFLVDAMTGQQRPLIAS